MPYNTIQAYLADKMIESVRDYTYTNRTFYRCPLHEENTASFCVYHDTDTWRCFGGCNDYGSLAKLIKLYENVPWSVAYEIKDGRKTSQSGVKPQSPSSIKKKIGRPYATLWQRLLLTETANFWHEQLIGPTSGSHTAYHYLLTRGIAHQTLANFQIGFAPGDRDGSYYTALSRRLEKRFGERWEEEAAMVGIVSVDTAGRPLRKLRMQYRVTFSSVDADNLVTFYQGRILPPGTSICKYLGPTTLAKWPFSLAVDEPVIEATVCAESPMGPAVLAYYGVPNLATLGNGIDLDLILRYHYAPLLWAQDNDRPRTLKDKDGRSRLTPQGHILSIQPGEIQAQAALDQCQRAGIEAYRLLPPAQTKGIDEWVSSQQSIDPLIYQYEQLTRKQVKRLAFCG